MRSRVKEWLKRYLPAELLSVVATLGAAAFTHYFTQNPIKTALAGTWGGNVAYFGTILLTDMYRTRRQRIAAGQTYRFKSFLKNIRALVIEFGLAEIADSFFIRPLLMYYLPIWLGNLPAGILAAKLLADVTFYVPAILSYEWSKRRFRDTDA